MRALVYVQHLLGIGHLMRAARIARAMVEIGFDVTFVTGGVPVAGVVVPGARLVQLPPLTTADDTFAQLVDDARRAVDDAYKGRRREQLLAVLDETAPHVVLTEMYPFGRRQMRFEVEPLLERAIAQTPRPIIAASVRDILVPRKPDRVAEMVDRVRRYFDLVLVHGDPRLIGFGETFPRLADIEERVQYTGYVVDRPSAGVAARAGVGEGVVVSIGGGAVGARLLRAAMAARPLSPLDRVAWHLLAGEKMPAEQFETLRAGGRRRHHRRADARRLRAAAGKLPSVDISRRLQHRAGGSGGAGAGGRRTLRKRTDDPLQGVGGARVAADARRGGADATGARRGDGACARRAATANRHRYERGRSHGITIARDRKVIPMIDARMI